MSPSTSNQGVGCALPGTKTPAKLFTSTPIKRRRTESDSTNTSVEENQDDPTYMPSFDETFNTEQQ